MMTKAHTILTLPSSRVIRAGSCQIEPLARCLADEIIPGNPEGWAVDPRRQEIPSFGPLEYLVNLRGHDARYGEPPGLDEILAWLRPRARLLSLEPRLVRMRLNRELGLSSLHVTVPVEGRKLALAFGGLQEQQHVFHPASGATIRLGDDDNGVA